MRASGIANTTADDHGAATSGQQRAPPPPSRAPAGEPRSAAAARAATPAAAVAVEGLTRASCQGSPTAWPPARLGAVVDDRVRRTLRLFLLRELARGALVERLVAAAEARSWRISSSAITAIVASKPASMPDSNSSGTSTTARAGAVGGSSCPGARPRSARRRAATAAARASAGPRRWRTPRRASAAAVDGPVGSSDLGAEALDDRVADLGPTRRARARPGRSTGTAAPSRSSAASAVDLPAPMPPVSPMKGITRSVRPGGRWLRPLGCPTARWRCRPAARVASALGASASAQPGSASARRLGLGDSARSRLARPRPPATGSASAARLNLGRRLGTLSRLGARQPRRPARPRATASARRPSVIVSDGSASPRARTRPRTAPARARRRGRRRRPRPAARSAGPAAPGPRRA